MVERVLPSAPVASLAAYEATGGGRGVRWARDNDPREAIDVVTASGLRGRGGAGFPTGMKWQTVAGLTADRPPTVVVNGAEGEPGTFKDRLIMERNPFAVLEGALIAAHAVGAAEVILAVKAGFGEQVVRLQAAAGACAAAGWSEGVRVRVVTGPAEYLFGEETGLLEVLDGRPPFPRIAPPYRHGVDDAGPVPSEPAGAELTRGLSGGPAPTLVNNVETLANVPAIVANGADWFRAIGTDDSPGTVVCTVSGSTARHGVGEVALGTPLAEVIELVGGGTRRARNRLVAALPGVANAVVTAEAFDTPLTHERFRDIGSGLGSAGFLVYDDETDFAAVAAGVARFLSVESCGQCTPCKQDGLALADLLDRICASTASEDDLAEVVDRLTTVATGARCNLASQQEVVIGSLLDDFPDHFVAHIEGRRDAVAPELIAPMVSIEGDVAVLDDGQAAKQPDWTFDPVDSGKTPVERLAEGGTEAPD
jgi:NADH-quinone oxidoreductase subunit F